MIICERQPVLLIFPIFRLCHAHMRKDNRNSAFYCNRQKAGWGLGARLQMIEEGTRAQKGWYNMVKPHKLK